MAGTSLGIERSLHGEWATLAFMGEAGLSSAQLVFKVQLCLPTLRCCHVFHLFQSMVLPAFKYSLPTGRRIRLAGAFIFVSKKFLNGKLYKQRTAMVRKICRRFILAISVHKTCVKNEHSNHYFYRAIGPEALFPVASSQCGTAIAYPKARSRKKFPCKQTTQSESWGVL